VTGLFGDQVQQEEAEVVGGEDPSGAATAPEGAFLIAKRACKGAASPEMTFLTGAVASVGFSEVFFEVFEWVSHGL